MKVGDLVQYDVAHDSPFVGAVIKVATPKMVLVYWFNGCWEDKTVWCRGYDFDNLKKLEGKWMGMLERTDGTSDMLNLKYSITSNGSALLEESNTGGIEMLTIFNNHNEKLLATHYCGLQNKPILDLVSFKNGVFSFKTDTSKSGLKQGKEMYVDTWSISLSEDGTEMDYIYTVVGPDGVAFTATAKLKRMG